jgi:tetratricopeptide (TPR) repeat protein
MKRQISLLLVLTLSSVLAFGQSPRKYLKAGEDFAEVNKFDDAIEQFSKAIEADPEYEDAYIARAGIYERLRKYEEAAKDYERALVFNNKDEGIYYQAGLAYYNAGKLGVALAKLNAALELKSNMLEAYQTRTLVYIGLGRYDEALEDCKRALRFKENEINFYNLGLVYEKLEMYDQAVDAYQKSINKNNNVIDVHLALGNLAFRRGNYSQAMESANNIIRINSRNKEGLMLRSKVHAKQMNISKAVDDISVAINMFQGDPDLYELRGDFYQQLSRHSDAVVDFTNALDIDPDRAGVYYKRALSYENMRNYEDAMADYNKLLEMSEFDGNAQRLLAQTQERLYEINREEDKPVVTLVDPASTGERTVNIPKGIDVIPLTGKVVDDSDIKSLKVNDFTVQPTKKKDHYEFLASLNLRDASQITVEVSDIYDNTETAIFNIVRTETDAPEVSMIAPYASDNAVIYLDSNEPIIYVEGKISDESLIKSIYIDDIAASYVPTDKDPVFSARVNVENRGVFTVRAEDIYGNVANIDFTLNREAANFTDNPMGKTWAVFIENSEYEYFASLEGPGKDVTLMKTALARYQVHNLIHKKNMTKTEMERFFAIELRDLLRGNRVSSIMVWYAGHGKFINETGYWIPVDAERDEEFTYYSINALKASMQSYPESVTHTLVVTDACESGPSFYQAMRSGLTPRSCDDWEATRFKSSQVLSSAGYELAVDDSQFTRTFANTLANNPGNCIPIESIVQKVTTAVTGNNQQKPQFGKISGLEDENGTFFFIPKDY